MWSLEPPAIAGLEQAITNFVHPDEDDVAYWGRGVSGNSHTRVVDAAEFQRAIAVAVYEGDALPDVRRPFADELADALEQWVSGVTAWLEVIAGRVIRDGATTPFYPGRRRFVSSQALACSGDSVFLFASVGRYTGTYFTDDGISAADWERACTLVNASAEPPLERVLLADSRGALRQRDHRQAVVDAATATEVVLASAIATVLARSSATESNIDQLMRNTNGLVELYDLHAALGDPVAVSRGRLADQLAGVRNRAVHAGRPPTPDEAKRAVELAALVLDQAAPLA
jgi:hypothetical protein